MSRSLRLTHRILSFLLLICFFCVPHHLMAADGPRSSSMDNPLAVIMIIIIGALLLVIVLLAYVVTGAAQVYMQKWKEEKKSGSSKTIFTIALLLAGNRLFAQEATTVAKDTSIGGLSQSTLFTLISVIGIELFVILSLIYFLQRLLAKQEVIEILSMATAGETVKPTPKWKIIWEKMNSFRSLKEEAQLDLGHEYDSIRELDNRLPPWWIYGFYVTIIFSVIYLWQHHVSHTAPLSIDEYNTEMMKAEEEKEVYLASQKNKVDETNVTMLDESGIAAGKTIFIGTCAACHGPNGQGLVGPNLTDDYWLHGGSLKSIFKTIKYGVQEKGMKSWKDDYTPQQLAQLASFVRSLHGTKPANPKEPQGEVYEEKQDQADSTKKNNAAL